MKLISLHIDNFGQFNNFDYVFEDVCCHRMVFNNNSPLDDENSKEVIKEILNSVTINI